MDRYSTVSALSPSYFETRDRFSLDGDPLGQHSVLLEFAGTQYLLCGVTDSQRNSLYDRFHAHVALSGDSNQDPIVVDVVRTKTPQDISVIRNGEYSLDTIHEPNFLLIRGHDFIARIDFQPQLRGTIGVCMGVEESVLGVFENFLRILVAYRLLQAGGLLVHSAGMVRNGKALLFYGVSGAGKSTISRLAKASGWEILSDDLNAVFVKGSRAWIQKIPFTGDFTQTTVENGCYPLSLVLRLVKGTGTTVRRLSPGKASASLMVCAPSVNVDPYRNGSLMDNIARMVSRMAVGEVSFSKQSNFDDLASDVENCEYVGYRRSS